MELHRECRDCIFKWVYERTEPYVQEAARPLLAKGIMETLRRDTSEPVNAGLMCNRAVFSTRKIESASLSYYHGFKEDANKEAERLLPAAGEYIEAGRTNKEKLERAFSVAAAGNVSPLSAPSAAFTFPEITEILKGAGSPVIMGDLYYTIQGARRALYITDNAGEVGFDSLVLRLLKQNKVHTTLVVKEEPFFEDAGVIDALRFDLDQMVDGIVVHQGFPVIGDADPLLDRAYRASDLIIGKGTGSYEALQGELEGKKAVFMLKVKCGPISRDTGVEQGTVLVKVDA